MPAIPPGWMAAIAQGKPASADLLKLRREAKLFCILQLLQPQDTSTSISIRKP